MPMVTAENAIKYLQFATIHIIYQQRQKLKFKQEVLECSNPEYFDDLECESVGSMTNEIDIWKELYSLCVNTLNVNI